MNEYKNWKEYLDKVMETKLIYLVIIGIDRYPEDFKSYIPFCKENWKQQFSRNCAGNKVLRALNVNNFINKRDELMIENKTTPKDYFYNLLIEQGIAFLNISYEFVGGKIAKKAFDSLEKYWLGYNKTIINKSKSVVMCGRAVESYLMYKLGSSFDTQKFRFAYHPSARAKSRNHPEYYKAFWDDNKLNYYLTK